MEILLKIIKEQFLDNPISTSDFQYVYTCDDSGSIQGDIGDVNGVFGDMYELLKDEGLSLKNFNTLLILGGIEIEGNEKFRSLSIFTYEGLITFRRKSVKSSGTFYYDSDDDLIGYFLYEDIKDVKLIKENGFFRIRIYYSNSETATIILKRFGTLSERGIRLVTSLIEYFVKNLQNKMESSIYRCIENEEFSKALSYLEDYASLYDVEDVEFEHIDFYCKNKAMVFYSMGKKKEAHMELDKLIKLKEEKKYKLPDAYELKAYMLKEDGNLLKAVNNIAYSIENYYDNEDKCRVIHEKDELYTTLSNHFFNIRYEDRKLVFITDDIYHTTMDNLVMIKKNELPKGISFPIGHPHLNKIYTCHPLKKDSYIPLDDFQKELFIDKVNEFTYLAQCLGATKVSIDASEGKGIDSVECLNSKINGDLDFKTVSANVDAELESKSKSVEDAFLQIRKIQTFKPTQTPYIPKGCLWLDTNIGWQRLVDQRLSGNILTHQEIISISSNSFVSEQEVKNINAELKILLSKVKGGYSKKTEYEMNTKERYECKISVEFEDKNLLSDNTVISKNLELPTANENLEKYKEDILFMLEDDSIIDESERAILDRKIKKYGISLEDAKRIEEEAMLCNFTQEEVAYINELKDVIEDGEITEIELKMLDRYAKKFNISTESQEKIHSIYLK